ncbi:MAG: arginine--tRNA ligase [Bacilli bacterium]
MKDKLRMIIIDAIDADIKLEDILVEIPKEKENGDYSTNIAMKLSKLLHDSPLNIANKIVANISNTDISKMEIKGPGFINFFVKKDYLIDNLNEALKLGDNYGRSDIGNHRKINIEYVSANPTGILHLGHARGASIGDSLSRIMSFAGFDITREYYINDAGNQMNNLGKSIKIRYLNLCGIDEELEEGLYHGKEIIEIAKTLYEKHNNSLIDKEISYFKQLGLEILLEEIKSDLKLINVEFDIYSSEQSLYDTNKVINAFNSLKEKGYTYELDGATWLKTSLFGDEKDRVLIKNDSNNTYLLPDIAYHMDKINRGYDELIDILGADHHGYIDRLKASIQMMGEDPKKISILILQMVRLIKDNEEVKMSKRTGKAVTINEFVKEVGKDPIRYFFAAKAMDTQMDFDMDLALTKSNENPVFYINYAHARICSILRDKKDIDLNDKKIVATYSKNAYNVLDVIYRFKETVENAALKKETHIITNYLYLLASTFHSYYASELIITDNIEETVMRLRLIMAVKITIKNALNLLGIDAYEKM